MFSVPVYDAIVYVVESSVVVRSMIAMIINIIKNNVENGSVSNISGIAYDNKVGANKYVNIIFLIVRPRHFCSKHTMTCPCHTVSKPKYCVTFDMCCSTNIK